MFSFLPYDNTGSGKMPAAKPGDSGGTSAVSDRERKSSELRRLFARHIQPSIGTRVGAGVLRAGTGHSSRPSIEGERTHHRGTTVYMLRTWRINCVLSYYKILPLNVATGDTPRNGKIQFISIPCEFRRVPDRALDSTWPHFTSFATTPVPPPCLAAVCGLSPSSDHS